MNLLDFIRVFEQNMRNVLLDNEYFHDGRDRADMGEK